MSISCCHRRSAFLALALSGIAFALLHQLRRERDFAARVALAHGETPIGDEHTDGVALRTWLTQAVTTIGQTILRTGLLSSRTRRTWNEPSIAAACAARTASACSSASRSCCWSACRSPTALALDGVHMAPRMHVMLPAGAAVIGLLAPDWVIGNRRQRVMGQLEAGLPDALDMMVICAQAGLGLGPTIIRVGTELAPARPEIAREFLLTANDLQIMSDSRVALNNLGTRSGLDSMKRLVTTLTQTMVYGTPLTEALRMLSVEMRQETLTRFEARAARLPVLLTLPTVVFILPCVFLIVGGPAVIQVVGVLSKM